MAQPSSAPTQSTGASREHPHVRRRHDTDPSGLPPPPRCRLSGMRRIKELRALHSGQEVLRDAGGDVTNVGVGPAWLAAPMVLVTSPARTSST